METKLNKFIFATGGTGGHIFPAIAVYERLKKINPKIEILFVISERPRDKMILEEYGCRYEVLPMSSWPSSFSFIKFVGFTFAFLKSLKRSFKILLRFKPRVVVGFGCYVSVPVGTAAFFLKHSLILHEQNVIPSRSNLFLKKLSALVLLSFEETKKFFLGNNTKVIGNPLREGLKPLEKKEAAARLKIDSKTFNIFIMGGSQGAKVLNEVVPSAISLLDEEKKRKISVLHLSGHQAGSIQKHYNEGKVRAKVLDFLKEMEFGFCACDLAIARSGALSLSELAWFGLPAILIPYAYDRGFQLENAKYYANKGAAFVLEEKDFNALKLKEVIENVMEERSNFLSLRQGMLSLKRTSAAREFSDIILNYEECKKNTKE